MMCGTNQRKYRNEKEDKQDKDMDDMGKGRCKGSMRTIIRRMNKHPTRRMNTSEF